ncbi:MAG: GYDIA family GHMP kinase [Wenyingzhuangia sp.]|jgi:mevalonate kinase|uniref:GYDIA family GHMP kinase n=1 Tax=Wenyingzhuangia sp. TaxID=1964193 RepID=UPI00321B611B
MQKYYSNGKLLISGEYLVLDGAISLALPTVYGQSLEVFSSDNKSIFWKSYTVEKECWFQAEFGFEDFEIIRCTSLKDDGNRIANTLQEILIAAKNLNPNFLKDSEGLEVRTSLDFPNHWGLGTSSTLINNIALWANIDAFELLENSFGGSGYDIACAQNNQAITYQREKGHKVITTVDFSPEFKEELFFVYLNQKQDSKEGINMYRSLETSKEPFIEVIDDLTRRLVHAKTIKEFSELLNKHEALVAKLLETQTVKAKLFENFKGSIKSLGAWGGDFVLVTGKREYVFSYFEAKGYETILSYQDLILS